MRSSQSGSTRTSSSVVTMMSPLAIANPQFNAALRPCSRSNAYVSGTGNVGIIDSTTARVASGELLSTTTTSQGADGRSAARLFSVSARTLARLYVAMTMENLMTMRHRDGDGGRREPPSRVDGDLRPQSRALAGRAAG